MNHITVTIECSCGEKYQVSNKATHDNLNDHTELDMYVRESGFSEPEVIVFECDKCTSKLRIKLNEY